MTREFQRPLVQAGEMFEWIVGAPDPAEAHQLAHDTAWALLDRVRSAPDRELVQRVVRLADGEGIHDIAELWSAAHPRSLAGILWRLYLLQRVITTHREAAVELFGLGVQHAQTIDPVVVGAPDPVSPDALDQLCDEILRGAFAGDFSVALDRAASTCHVLATGATALADERDAYDDAHAHLLTRQALRFDQFARDLRHGSALWLDGTLE